MPKEKEPKSAAGGLPPLPITVIYATSEDDPFPASELNKVVPTGHVIRGWHSEKFGTFPQELIFRFEGEVQLTHLQILVHECKIPTKVEVYVSSLQGLDPNNPPSVEEAHFNRLGFLAFNSNEKSKFRSREQKTVNMSATAYYLKLLLHKCHSNSLNVHNQVGLMRVDGFGRLAYLASNHKQANLPSSGSGGHAGVQLPPVKNRGKVPPQGGGGYAQPTESENIYPPVVKGGGGGGQMNYPPQAPTRPVGRQQLPPMEYQAQPNVPVYQRPLNAIPQQQAGHYRSQPILQFEEYYLKRTRELVQQKAQAIDVEEFDTAKWCKLQLESLQKLSEKIYEYEGEKVKAIYDEEFESAQHAKVRMDKLIDAAYSLAAHDPTHAEEDGQQQPPQRKPQPRQTRRQNDGRDDDDVIQEALGVGRDLPSKRPPQENNNGPRNDYDEQPVPSKYAQMMAEQAAKGGGKKQKKNGKKKKSAREEEEGEDDVEEDEADEEPEEGEETEEHENEEEGSEEGNLKKKKPIQHQKQQPPVSAKKKKNEQHQGKKKKKKRVSIAEVDEDEENEEEPEDAEDEDSGKRHSDTDVNDDEKEEERIAMGGQQRISEDDAIQHKTQKEFNLNQFAEWERDVYFAIHDEIGPDTQEPPAEPVDRSLEQTVVGEMNTILGQYTTACLFSRRWRLRDAGMKVLSKFIAHHYKHIPTPTAVAVILKYMDIKGYGLMDPIAVCFLASCDFLVRLIEGRIEDCTLQSVQIPVANLLPRLLLRSGDATQKTREEALALILCIANSMIGPERVGLAVVADPVDADKKKISPNNYRPFVSRLQVLQQLLQEHAIAGRGLSIDTIMNKLLIPCLNHSSNEVREQAVIVIGFFDAVQQQEVMRYLHLVKNGATKAAVEEKLELPPDEEKKQGGPHEPQEAAENKKPRQTHATDTNQPLPPRKKKTEKAGEKPHPEKAKHQTQEENPAPPPAQATTTQKTPTPAPTPANNSPDMTEEVK